MMAPTHWRLGIKMAPPLPWIGHSFPVKNLRQYHLVMASARLIAVDYEVFGRVQGVFFRKYTRMKGKELGLRGWVKNTAGDTVVGQLEGSEGAIATMKDWLQRVGSPGSIIEKCNFSNEKAIQSYSHTDFVIRH